MDGLEYERPNAWTTPQSQQEVDKVASPSYWKALCASSLGSSHRENNTALQDYGISVTYPFPALIIADGAGSATHSAIGAETAVKASLDYIRWHGFGIDDPQKCLGLYERVLAALEEKARELGVEISNLATTLSLAYVLSSIVYWMQVGDGYIVVQRSGIIGCVSVPTKGEFVNETVFVTDLNARAFIQHGAFPVSQCDGIMAFTDGLEWFLIDIKATIPAPVCSSLIRQLKQEPKTVDDLKELLDNRFSSGSKDDKTMGFLVPVY